MSLAAARVARPALAALAALVLLAWLPARADAADGPLGACSGQELERPFLPWLDPARYVLVPDGGVERGAEGWTLSGGAAVQDGNERYRVGGADDARSLALPPGAVATTPPLCIGVAHPTVRFFARNTGSLLSTLAVAVVFEGLDGRPQSLPLGLVAAGPGWQPTLPLLLLTNLLAVLPAGQRAAFRFTPVGGAGSWSIDDVYVDPYSKG